MFSLSLVLFFCMGSVLVIFSKDINEKIKKFFANKWLALFIPLLLASFLVAYFETYILFGLLSLKWALYQALVFFVEAQPLHKGAWLLAATPILLGLSIMPVYLLVVIKKRKTVIPITYAGFMSALLWLFVVVIFATSMHG